MTFGNGVNGMLVPSTAPIQAQYKITAGSSGNLQSEMNWSVQGLAEIFGTNPEPTSGGLDATTLDELRDQARIDADENHPLITASDVEQAALSFADLGVTRAVEMPYDSSQPPGSRLLVVAGPHDPGDAGPDLAESQEFLAAVRKRLTPRLPLGQSIKVESPQYVPVQITATLTAARNADPAIVQASVIQALQQRVPLVTPDGTGVWPLGRAVTQHSVEGWLRKAPGVAQVVSVKVSAGSTFGVSSLPDLQVAASGITVNRPAAGSLQ